MTALNTVAGLWAPVMLTITWQAALLAGLVLACESALRLRQPRARHAVWWLVLAAPLVLAPARLALECRAATVTVPSPQVVLRVVELTRSLAPPLPSPTAPAGPLGARQEARAILPVAPETSASPGAGFPTTVALMALWVVGCAVIVARLLLGHRALVRIIAASRPVTHGGALDSLEAVCGEAGRDIAPALRCAADLSAPLLYGLRSPVILIPEDWLDSLSPTDLRVVLAHEVAHIKRGDLLANLAQRMVELPLFFHPAAWLAGRRIGLAREELCDAAALGKDADVRIYALALLAAAERTRGTIALVSVGVAEGKFTLLRRVEAIMRGRSLKRLHRAAAAGLALVLLSAAAMLAIADVSGTADIGGTPATAATPKALFPACSPGHPAGPGLFVADSDLANPIRLTTPRPDLPSGEDNSPGTASGCDIGTWSPDGTRVVMARTMLLYVMDLRALIEYPDQEPVPLRRPNGVLIGGADPCWSPDGNRIAFDDGAGVCLVNPDGTGYRVVAPVGVRAREAEWSPDGKSIAFRLGPEGNSHLYVVTSVDGPGEPRMRQLTNDPRWQEFGPHWSPESDRLAFTRGPVGDRSQDGDVWLLDVATGEETQLTDTPSLPEHALAWSPFDGKVYYAEYGQGAGGKNCLVRMEADGTGVERFQRDILAVGRLTWANIGTWIEGANALPGESVVARLGAQSAEGAAEAIADIGYSGCCRTITPLDVTLGASTHEWAMLQPQVGNGILSAHAYAQHPENQALSGPAHLFDLHLGNSSLARPDDLQLLTLRGLYLGDSQGMPLTGPALAGGIRTIPFAALALGVKDKRINAVGDVELWIAIKAVDRNGEVMAGFDGPVHLGTYFRPEPEEYWVTRNTVIPAEPETIMLHRGVWSGKVLARSPRPGAPLLAYWGDIAAYSDPLIRMQPSEGKLSAP